MRAGTSATLTARVEVNGALARSNFEWGATTALGKGTAKVSLASGCAQTTVQATVSGLSADQTYYFRAVVESDKGSVYPSPARMEPSSGAASPTVPPTTPTSTTPTPTTPAPTTPTPTTTAPPSGDQPFPVQLHAVNKAGSEYACAQGWGFFEGPVDAASVQAMRSWGINAVRLPLNESCWLAINGAPSRFSGAAYQAAIQDYVNLLHANGMYAILDLHWSAAGSALALGQDLMANKDHSPAFWTSVSAAFKNDPMTAFDLYNEPHGISWSVWKNGDAKYAGMDELIAAVRSSGARNWVISSGLEWSNDLRGWLSNRPSDSVARLAAGAHVYNFNRCATSTCWDKELAPVADAVPLFVTEMGQDNCASDRVLALFAWADAHGVDGYAPWAWNTSMSCGGGPGLIADSSGTPTGYGRGVQDWYLRA